MSLNVNTDATLPRSHPGAQGVSAAAIAAFLDDVQAKNLELHSFMLLKNGFVISEGWWKPYAPDLPHSLFSLSKSFAATAIGLAVSEGRLSLEDQVISFFPDESPSEVSANLHAMQVRHLLMMGTGHDQDVTNSMVKHASGNWVEGFLQQPVDHAPGTHFAYNSGASYMLSAIIHKVTGQSLLDYLRPRLLNPLGIAHATWDTCPRGIPIGGWGLSVTTESIAKFGQLYLQQGIWNGERILNEDWVKEASVKHISNGDGGDSDWAQGYGYQFWRCRHGAFRGDGAFGQFCVVLPEHNAVIAITSGLKNMQLVLDSVWEHLLPGIRLNNGAEPDETNTDLTQRLQALQYQAPASAPLPKIEETGLAGQFQLEKNELYWERIGLRFEGDEAHVQLCDPSGDHYIRCGEGTWIEQRSCLNDGKDQLIAASFAWLDSDSIELTVRYLETPFCHTAVFQLDGEQLSIDVTINVNFGESFSTRIIGQKNEREVSSL
ncbi:serine hydrolase domain-containing protein [Paenibacillus roseipurpureus]|uniref:Serine hydrolase n=1 Tax=Paenibacillus roseopurpureus TaxID=2918901 RepID=A0AA96RIA7_9BACL|nr:serine hydrolase [Paenibacillus sp. MBLB1832]WNR42064.1 serine hydrolase [Paenibacillus sp. MBLB1832]